MTTKHLDDLIDDLADLAVLAGDGNGSDDDYTVLTVSQDGSGDIRVCCPDRGDVMPVTSFADAAGLAVLLVGAGIEFDEATVPIREADLAELERLAASAQPWQAGTVANAAIKHLPALIAAIRERDAIIDDMAKDAGLIDQAALPATLARAATQRLREALERVRDICLDGHTPFDDSDILHIGRIAQIALGDATLPQ